MCAERCSWIWTLFLLLAGAALGRGLPEGRIPPAFRHFDLKPAGRPDLEIFDDFNGDGRPDIMLCDDRLLSVFLGSEKGQVEKPSFVMKAPAKAIFLDVGDIDGDGIREPIFLHAGGVCRSYCTGNQKNMIEELLTVRNGFFPPQVDRLVFLNFVRDITGDGREDFIVPFLDRFVVYENPEEGKIQAWGEIPFAPQADFFTEKLSQTGQLKEVVHLPCLLVGQENKVPVVMLYDGTCLSAFRRSPDGPFKVAGRRVLFDRDSRKYEEESRAYFGKNVLFEDLAGTGRPLLIVADNRNGKVDFYPGDSLAGNFKSRLTLRTDGWLLKPVFQDMNGDGLKDLILPSIERISMFTLLRIFFTSRFDIHYMIYFNRREPLYSLLPDLSRSVSLPLSFSAGPEGLTIKNSLIYTFDGDFDGNGILDFFCNYSPGKLGIYLDSSETGFSLEPDRTLDFHPLDDCSDATTRVYDLNLDGFSDILLHQQSIGKGVDQYDLFLSVSDDG